MSRDSDDIVPNLKKRQRELAEIPNLLQNVLNIWAEFKRQRENHNDDSEHTDEATARESPRRYL